MHAPKLFMALMETGHGVAFGTTSTNNQILCLPCSSGICNCLKLYSTWLLPKRKPISLGTSLTCVRMLGGNFLRTDGTLSIPITLRLAPVSKMANPVVCAFGPIDRRARHSASSGGKDFILADFFYFWTLAYSSLLNPNYPLRIVIQS